MYGCTLAGRVTTVGRWLGLAARYAFSLAIVMISMCFPRTVSGSVLKGFTTEALGFMP